MLSFLKARFQNLVSFLRFDLPTRLLFGVLGALACLVIAGLLEFCFAQVDMIELLNARATRVLLFNNNTVRRSTKETLKTGDVQITLKWHNHNDLDLWCVDPANEKIYFRNLRARSWGELDLDMNAGGDQSGEPVENIFWPKGSAPKGTYKVYVHEYARHGDPDPTYYEGSILVHGESTPFSGTLRWGEPIRLIRAFEIKNGPFIFLGLRSGAWFGILVVGAWVGLTFAALALILLEAQDRWYRRFYQERLLSSREKWRVVGRTLALGLGIGGLSQAFFAIVVDRAPDDRLFLPRIIGWVCFSLLTAGLFRRWIPNLLRITTWFAGGLGGWAAALLFNALSVSASDALGRVVGATVIGFLIGFLILLIVEQEETSDESLPMASLSLMSLQPYRLSSGHLRGAEDDGVTTASRESRVKSRE